MSDRASPSDWLEDIVSLLPAVTLLQGLGSTYLMRNRSRGQEFDVLCSHF
jgi:hypothetical protein